MIMNDDEKSKGALTFFVEERVEVSQSAVLLPRLRVLKMMMNYDYWDGDYDNYDHVVKLIFFVGMTICRAYDSICCTVSLSVFLH